MERREVKTAPVTVHVNGSLIFLQEEPSAN